MEAPQATEGLEIRIAMEDVVRTVSLPARAGATAVIELAFSPRREHHAGADVERVGPVLRVRDSHDPDAPARLLTEYAGTFPGVDGPRLILTFDADRRH
jgi:hypothetical protein